jgi:hypothetical protein
MVGEDEVEDVLARPPVEQYGADKEKNLALVFCEEDKGEKVIEVVYLVLRVYILSERN